MSDPNIRWRQRLHSYTRALSQLALYAEKERLSQLEKPGFIKSFEFVYELSWNLLRDYLLYQGFEDIRGSRDTFRLAFRERLIQDGGIWMNMIKARNQTSHAYNEATASSVMIKIREDFFEQFIQLQETMQKIAASEETEEVTQNAE